MSTLADKMGLPKGLLDAVNGVLSEELSDKQKKIDKNKNGKIDGQDLAILRKEDQDLEEGGEQYKVKSIGYDPKKGDYFVHPTTGEKVYKSGVSKGDHVNPKTGEVKKKVAESESLEENDAAMKAHMNMGHRVKQHSDGSYTWFDDKNKLARKVDGKKQSSVKWTAKGKDESDPDDIDEQVKVGDKVSFDHPMRSIPGKTMKKMGKVHKIEGDTAHLKSSTNMGVISYKKKVSELTKEGVAEGLKQMLRKVDPTIKSRLRSKADRLDKEGDEVHQDLKSMGMEPHDAMTRNMDPEKYYRNADRYRRLTNKEEVELQGVAEGFFDRFRKKQQNYGGIDVSVEKEDNNILVKATANGRELGRVLFTPSEQDDNLLVPLDLEVDKRYRGQGIGATMYDYVKSLGYTIRRSQYQTDAGARFWDKHKSGKNVWEQGVAEGISSTQIDRMKAEYSKIDKIDPSSDNYKKLISMLDKLGKPELQTLSDAGIKFVSGLAKNRVNRMGMKKEETQLDEGAPSQRHPLEGHDYHKKSDAELIYIGKDAHKAAEAMKGHNTNAENKYRDQANDAATVRYFRQKNGMPDWYKKKYGHDVKKEEVNPETEKLMKGQMTKTGVAKWLATGVDNMKKEEKIPEFKSGGKPLEKKFNKTFKDLGVDAKVKIKTVGNVSANEEVVSEASRVVKRIKDLAKKKMMKKEEETPSKANVEKGDQLTGKKEPIEVNPEVKS
jgi:hypothetical protein